ncbi:GNAT family N-acetyltransferase [Chitinophaga sp. Mgbs1]|uniref:GNAT family N-acetyltransferase n=1 Tax=Chitinophaga solisilvae TaxID=1233460 RepID=A0A433WDR9_9BACT|nr:GNAT family N-acetyltransferase [Chitinophaga solisilvae]
MYKCLSENNFSLNEYAVTAIREEDIYLIKQWRNEQMDILRQDRVLTDEDQRRYFSGVIFPSFEAEKPAQVLFSFLKDGKLIGYGGIVHISWRDKRGELSFLLETGRNNDKVLYRKELNIFFNLLCQPFFGILKFNKITTEAYDLRPYLIEELEHIGFRHEGTLKGQNLINDVYVDSVLHAFFRSTYEAGATTQNVLITSVSRKVPLIEAVRKAVVKTGRNVAIYGADTSELAIGRHFVDVFWQMPLLKELSAEALIAYCKANRITTIIPTRDGELAFFARHYRELESNGIHVMISPEESIALCVDKLLFYEKCSTHGISAIPAALLIDTLEADSYVVKERYGAGARSIGLGLDRQAAVIHSATLESPIFQPFIKGEEYSIDVYISREQELKGMVIRRRDYVVNGESQITSNVAHEGIRKLVTQFVNTFKFYGHLVLQVIVDHHNDAYLVECNPRFGGASSFSVNCGLDTFYWLLKESSEESIASLPFNYNENNRYKQIRYSKDLIITN